MSGTEQIRTMNPPSTRLTPISINLRTARVSSNKPSSRPSVVLGQPAAATRKTRSSSPAAALMASPSPPSLASTKPTNSSFTNQGSWPNQLRIRSDQGNLPEYKHLSAKRSRRTWTNHLCQKSICALASSSVRERTGRNRPETHPRTHRQGLE
jgi:hypothetical protein